MTRRKALGLAWCSGCKDEKPVGCFNKNAANKTYGVNSFCKICYASVQKKQRNKRWKNDAQAEKTAIRSRNLMRQFNITNEQYMAMYEQQGGYCSICKKQETANAPRGGTKMLAVDHSHVTGQLRGLLCNKCNKGLGFFDDCPILLEAALFYLKKFGSIDKGTFS